MGSRTASNDTKIVVQDCLCHKKESQRLYGKLILRQTPAVQSLAISPQWDFDCYHCHFVERFFFLQVIRSCHVLTRSSRVCGFCNSLILERKIVRWSISTAPRTSGPSESVHKPPWKTRSYDVVSVRVMIILDAMGRKAWTPQSTQKRWALQLMAGDSGRCLPCVRGRAPSRLNLSWKNDPISV